MSKEEMQRLVHELEVHQIELEMQNAELRQARDDVETLLEKYTDLYDFSPIGYFTLGRDGGITAANLTGATLLGVERARLLGRRFGLFLSDESRPLFAEFLGKVFASKTKESCELTLDSKAKSPLFIQIEAVSFGSADECHAAVIDISKRRSAEDALVVKRQMLEELNQTLEARIAKAVDDLRHKDQMMILQDRLAIMGEMINNIAHQWRQPLNTLGLIIQEITLSYDSERFGREFLEESTDKGMAVVQHMSRTIDDFRNFFKPEKEKVIFDVNQVIVRTLSLIEKSFNEQKIDIALDIEGSLMVNGYPNEYAQVFLNIMMNARDAMIEKNINGSRISIRTFAEGEKSVATITDNGGGIVNGIIDRLFDPYFTTKGPDKGTGIGLFMSKTIIEKNMKGTLTVRNTENGAEFRIEV